MNVLYSAREIFGKNNDTNGAWQSYIAGSKLNHLSEVVSLDSNLNPLIVEPDYNAANEWENIVIDDQYETGVFTSLEYVLNRIKEDKKFNLLAVVIQPTEDCTHLKIENFDFMGYDLLDKSYDVSALTNCGGFDETFSSDDINTVGLIDDYQKAFDIRDRLQINNPNEYHANTNVIAVWRHRIIGQ